MENKVTELTKGFQFFDPKVVKPGADPSAVPKGRAPFDEGLVFMVGGGNFNEYQNVVQAMKKKGKTVVYGCSELMAPEEFLDQMAALGRGESVGGTDTQCLQPYHVLFFACALPLFFFWFFLFPFFASCCNTARDNCSRLTTLLFLCIL